MEQLLNESNTGLVLWQALLFVLLIFGIFISYKLIKYLNLKTRKLKQELKNNNLKES